MADIRDGERLPNLRGKEAYRQPDGRIALWDGKRHVIIGPNREGLRVALSQMKAAREHAKAQELDVIKSRLYRELKAELWMFSPANPLRFIAER